MARNRGQRGFDRDTDLRSLEAAVEVMLESIDDESESGFQILRASALVSVCSAFEHLIKARYVAFAVQDPGRAAEQLASAKVSVRMEVSDVLGLPILEQWFTVADELFKKAGSGRTSMSERVKTFLLDYCLLLGRGPRWCGRTSGGCARRAWCSLVDDVGARSLRPPARRHDAGGVRTSCARSAAQLGRGADRLSAADTARRGTAAGVPGDVPGSAPGRRGSGDPPRHAAAPLRTAAASGSR
jgi:hypothetical protein